MTVLRSYEAELEQQARGATVEDASTQTDPSDFVPTDVLVPKPTEADSNIGTMDDTSGVGCNTDGFDTSDGEDEEIMAQFLEQSLSKSTPDKPNLNSTHPMATPKMSTERRSS